MIPTKTNKTTWIYDLETFKYAFIAVFKDIRSDEIVIFEISRRKDQYKELIKFLSTRCDGLIGFNNLGFDYPVLHRLFYNRYNSFQIYEIASSIIKSKYSRIQDKLIKIPQLDLFTLWNYTNKNRSTSLKWLEFALRSESIEDLPYLPDTFLTEDMIDELIHYCIHDVLETEKFYNISKKHIELRKFYTEEENHNLISYSEPKLAKYIICKRLSEALDIPIGKIYSMRTERDVIDIKDIIFDYISFTDSVNIETLSKFKSITKFVGQSEIKFESKYKNVVRTYAEGGLHSSADPGIYKSNDDYVLVDVDFASFYPHLTFKNNLGPAHFPKDIFNKVYEGFYIERKKYPKSDPRNYVLKIVLNSAYGLSKDAFSPLYDPEWQLAVCINGQLLLTMLTEKICNVIDDITIIFENTDGAMYRIKRSDYDKLIQAGKEIEELCNIPLEYQICDSIIIRDCNNYLNKIKDGYIKSKGCFEIEKDYHKDHSMTIVPIALEKYFIEGIPIERTIRSHKNIYDFCIGKRAKKSDKNGESTFYLYYQDQKIPLTKTIRYYISTQVTDETCGEITKEYKNGSKGRLEAHPQKGRMYKCKLFNKYFESDDYQIDYTYYERECRKIINSIEDNQLKLF